MPPRYPALLPVSSILPALLIQDMHLTIANGLRVDAGRTDDGSSVATEVRRFESGRTAHGEKGAGFYLGLPWLVMTTTRMSVPRLVEVTTRRGWGCTSSSPIRRTKLSMGSTSTIIPSVL